MIDRIFRLPKVMEITGKCRTGIYTDMANGNFPSSIPIGKRSIGWLESDIEQWLHQQVEKRHAA
jgi:prophage regulatory protein